MQREAATIDIRDGGCELPAFALDEVGTTEESDDGKG